MKTFGLVIGILLFAFGTAAVLQHLWQSSHGRRPQSVDTPTTSWEPEPENRPFLQSLGYQMQDLPCEKDGCKIATKFRFAPVGPMVDLDALRAGLLCTKSPKLLLTVESLATDSKAQSRSQVLSLDDVKDSKQFELMVNRPESPTLYGIFICRDSANTGKCADKKVEHVSRIALAPLEAAKKKKPCEIPDHIYYFSPLVFLPTGALAFQPKPPGHLAPILAETAKYIMLRTPPREQMHISQNAQEVLRFDEGLTSIPLKYADGNFVVSIAIDPTNMFSQALPDTIGQLPSHLREPAALIQGK